MVGVRLRETCLPNHMIAHVTSRHGNPRLHNAQVVPLWDDVPAAMATGHLQPVSYVAPQGGGGGGRGGGGGGGGPIMMKDQQHSTTGLTETVMINSGMWKSGWHVFSLRFFIYPSPPSLPCHSFIFPPPLPPIISTPPLTL